MARPRTVGIRSRKVRTSITIDPELLRRFRRLKRRFNLSRTATAAIERELAGDEAPK